MNKKRIGIVIGSILIVGSLFTGCKEYDKPELVEISPSQTAFLIPLEGKTSNQAQLQSEDFLKKNLVSGKRIEVPHRWLQEGRGTLIEDGKWIPTSKVIIVERKPETRNWTTDTGTGTSAKNEGIKAETKESIAFSANMNCTAQIDEADAVKFLYRYNGSSLATIMDTEIHSRITTDFVEQCSQYALADLLLHKQDVMENIRKDVIPYFKERGITITAIGISGDFSYTNTEIQKSIDDKFKAEKSVQTAQSQADAIRIQASTLEDTMKLKELELKKQELDNQEKAIAKWNGSMPTVQSSGNGNGTIFNIPLTK
jgi:hypothetical protein